MLHPTWSLSADLPTGNGSAFVISAIDFRYAAYLIRHIFGVGSFKCTDLHMTNSG